MTRYCLACDLKDDPQLIQRYKDHHASVWPEITKSIRESGITDMQIFLTGSRLFMIIETDDAHFSFSKKAEADLSNPRIQEWESPTEGVVERYP